MVGGDGGDDGAGVERGDDVLVGVGGQGVGAVEQGKLGTGGGDHAGRDDGGGVDCGGGDHSLVVHERVMHIKYSINYK